MSFASRLRKAREERGLTQQAVADLLGISKSTYSGYETGKREPDVFKIKALSEVLSISADVLIGSNVIPISQTLSNEEHEHIKKYRVLDTHGKKVVDHVLNDEYDRMTHIESREEKGHITYISLYDLAASAGTGEPLGDTYYTTKIQIPTEQVPEDAHCCLRVNGNSMEPAYKDGDIVFVQRQDESVRVGEIGVFSLNGEGYMKRLGRQELESLNPKYPPIPIREFDDLRCFGRVLGKVSK